MGIIAIHLAIDVVSAFIHAFQGFVTLRPVKNGHARTSAIAFVAVLARCGVARILALREITIIHALFRITTRTTTATRASTRAATTALATAAFVATLRQGRSSARTAITRIIVPAIIAITRTSKNRNNQANSNQQMCDLHV